MVRTMRDPAPGRRTVREVARMKTKKALADPVFPNAGVEAWYRDKLQALVQSMAQDMMTRVLCAWREGEGPVPAVAQDARPKPSTSVLLERALAKWGGIWTRRFDNVSRRIA